MRDTNPYLIRPLELDTSLPKEITGRWRQLKDYKKDGSNKENETEEMKRLRFIMKKMILKRKREDDDVLAI